MRRFAPDVDLSARSHSQVASLCKLPATVVYLLKRCYKQQSSDQALHGESLLSCADGAIAMRQMKLHFKAHSSADNLAYATKVAVWHKVLGRWQIAFVTVKATVMGMFPWSLPGDTACCKTWNGQEAGRADHFVAITWALPPLHTWRAFHVMLVTPAYDNGQMLMSLR